MLTNISLLGRALLAAVFLLCGFTAVVGLVTLRLDTEPAGKIFIQARRLMFAAAGLFVLVLVLLAIAFLTDDFSIAAVSQYSSTGLPFFYKLSAVWAGSAGSLLLWSLCVLLMFALWLFGCSPAHIKFNAVALSVGAGVCLGFLALCLFTANPFAPSQVSPNDGAGLNPLLQNFWMVIHPPLLFVGYSAFAIPFIIASAALLTRSAEQFFLYSQLRRWLLFGICFLALGILTGARWSYLELGWGGYWAWDPVENTSLLPLLVAIAAFHSLAGIQVADRFKRWAVILAPVPFILCLLATFMTRSGVLMSIHAFGNGGMVSALLAFIGCCFLLWLTSIIRAIKSIAIGKCRVTTSYLDRNDILFWANIVFIATAAVIGAATFWPVISQIVGLKSAVILTETFYNRIISVVGIVLAFLVGLDALLYLQQHRGFFVYLISCCLAALVCFALVLTSHSSKLILSLACAVCAFSFVAVLMKLLSNLRAIGKIGGGIAHLGLLLLVVAAGFSATARKVQTLMTQGEQISLGRYQLIYDSFERKTSGDIAQAGPQIIIRTKTFTKTLWPHNNLYPGNKSTSEVGVHTGLFEDIYISFDGLSQDGRAAITVQLKPLMLWLWFAAVLIVAGAALAIIKGKTAAKN